MFGAPGRFSPAIPRRRVAEANSDATEVPSQRAARWWPRVACVPRASNSPSRVGVVRQTAGHRVSTYACASFNLAHQFSFPVEEGFHVRGVQPGTGSYEVYSPVRAAGTEFPRLRMRYSSGSGISSQWRRAQERTSLRIHTSITTFDVGAEQWFPPWPGSRSRSSCTPSTPRLVGHGICRPQSGRARSSRPRTPRT